MQKNQIKNLPPKTQILVESLWLLIIYIIDAMRECYKLNKNLKKNKIKINSKIRNKRELKEMTKNNLVINRNKMMKSMIIMIKRVILPYYNHKS